MKFEPTKNYLHWLVYIAMQVVIFLTLIEVIT